MERGDGLQWLGSSRTKQDLDALSGQEVNPECSVQTVANNVHSLGADTPVNELGGTNANFPRSKGHPTKLFPPADLNQPALKTCVKIKAAGPVGNSKKGSTVAHSLQPWTEGDGGRVPVWDSRSQRILWGNCAPLAKNIGKYLESHPTMKIWAGEGRQRFAVDMGNEKPIEGPILEGKEGPILEGKEGPILEGKQGPALEGKERPALEGKQGPVLEGVLEGNEWPIPEGKERPILEGNERPILEGKEGPILEEKEGSSLEGKEGPILEGSNEPKLVEKDAPVLDSTSVEFQAREFLGSDDGEDSSNSLPSSPIQGALARTVLKGEASVSDSTPIDEVLQPLAEIAFTCCCDQAQTGGSCDPAVCFSDSAGAIAVQMQDSGIINTTETFVSEIKLPLAVSWDGSKLDVQIPAENLSTTLLMENDCVSQTQLLPLPSKLCSGPFETFHATDPTRSTLQESVQLCAQVSASRSAVAEDESNDRAAVTFAQGDSFALSNLCYTEDPAAASSQVSAEDNSSV